MPSDRVTGGASDNAVTRSLLPDAVLAGVTVAVQLAAGYGSARWHGGNRPGGWDDLVMVAAGACLVLRRRYPVGVLAVTLAAVGWAKVSSQAGPVWIAFLVAFFSAAAARRRAAAITSLLAGYVIALWPPWRVGGTGGPSAAFALWLAAWLLVLLSVAEVIRMRSQRAQALARGREEELRRQASEERMRIARDLHDVVAHNIAVINVQANTALHLRERQPDRAWAALSAINDVSKRALVELRSVLGVLRQSGEDEPRAPAPGLDRLGELLAWARAAGLTVRLAEPGERPPLPANVDVAAYRIVQEALTNSARHAPGATATVEIECRDGAVGVRVEDDGGAAAAPAGRARPVPAPGGGNGLAGMRERAAALGGTLIAGPRPGGGFCVSARLPLGGPALRQPPAGLPEDGRDTR